MDMITFRENTEDVYAGIEWEAGTDEVEQVRDFLEDDMEIADVIHDGPVGIGVKPISEFGSKRLIREAIDYALANDRDSVTLVHKGNIMKFTEGAFRDWGYEVAEEEYGDDVITEDQLWEAHDGEQPEGAPSSSGPHRGQHAPAASHPHRRVLRHRDDEPQRRLHVRRRRRADRRSRHRARYQPRPRSLSRPSPSTAPHPSTRARTR